MLFRRMLATAAILMAGAGVVWACGPFFPWQLLDDREATILGPLDFTFRLEMARLVPPPGDTLKAVEERYYWYGDERPDAALKAEQKEAKLGAWNALVSSPPGDIAAFEAKLNAARNAVDGKAALAAGAGLPLGVLNYIAGAVEFRAGRLDVAARYFDAVMRLHAEQRQIRAVAATFMQARIKARKGDWPAARKAYQSVREIARGGAPDPMGLAVASFGDEAQIDLIEAGLVKPAWAPPVKVANEAGRVAIVANAIRLYAEQSARNSTFALWSLRDVASLLASEKNAGDLSQYAANPVIRRLLVANFIARNEAYYWDDEVETKERAGALRVVNAILAIPDLPAGEDLDRLASLLYQLGLYEDAEKLTATAETPLGLWVRAKLAMRRGDRAAAIRDWTAAVAGIDSTEERDVPYDGAKDRVRGELAVVRLSEGEYRDSLRLLLPTAYWGDVVHVAERVLTVDELKAFVDALPPDSAEELRALLARRLTRDGRVSEALPYFRTKPSKDGRTDADDARAFLAAVEDGRPGWPFDWPWQKVSRAEALFRVATLARNRGMELMGTEGLPDEAALGGAYSSGIGQPDLSGAVIYEGSLLGPDEANRFIASAPKPDVRFHYRVIATDRALEAADLLPERSQAYAATLCWAARFAADSSGEDRWGAAPGARSPIDSR
ncbi:MAG: hypothetical protein NTY59_09130 [Alphaproteobacteria bacterium]|nr:hypothetical protein [Alphaproteobacteria bacterium]